jgi:hypothetical protein
MQQFWSRIKHVRWRPSLRELIIFGAGALILLVGLKVAGWVQRQQKPLSPESPTITANWLPPTVKQYHTTIETMAKRYNLDPNLVAIIMTLESGGFGAADSGQARGLMQITPGTANKIAREYLTEPIQLYDLFNPSTSIEFGTAYLAKLRDAYAIPDHGANKAIIDAYIVELIAANYNGGPTAAQAIQNGEGLHDTQVVVYSRDVFNMWRERHAKSSPTFDRWKERGGSELIDKAQAAMQPESAQ